jgi:hypothetical protein
MIVRKKSANQNRKRTMNIFLVLIIYNFRNVIISLFIFFVEFFMVFV